MLPQLIDSGAELRMIAVLEKELIQDLEAHLLRWGIQPLDDRGVSLLRQIDCAGERQMQEVRVHEIGLDAGQNNVLAAAQIV